MLKYVWQYGQLPLQCGEVPGVHEDQSLVQNCRVGKEDKINTFLSTQEIPWVY